jgi:hypothetical protein
MTGLFEIPESEASESALSVSLDAESPDSGESVSPAPDDEAAQAEEDGFDPTESVGEARAVSVRMFDYDYNIMSDKPRLMEIVASTIDREARRLKSANAFFNRGIFNWPVQVAFKLALDNYHEQKALRDCRQELAECRLELENLTAQVERDAEKLAELIENGLNDY